MVSFYDVLLVDQNATLDEIKSAFKRRALQVHPDKGGSKEEFHLVYEALETLGDPVARKKYDHALSQPGIARNIQAKQKKRAGKPGHSGNSHPSSSEPPLSRSSKAHRPTGPRQDSTASTGEASSGPRHAEAEEPQSKKTKLVIKIHDLLKQLPREKRNDVILNQFSQKQRVLLEKWMVENAEPRTPGNHGKALPNQQEPPTMENGSPGKVSNSQNLRYPNYPDKEMQQMNVRSGACYALAVPTSKFHPKLKMDKGRAKGPNTKAAKVQGPKKRLRSSSGCLVRANKHYCARICFDSLVMRTAYHSDLKIALEDLVVLTSAKQKLINQEPTPSSHFPARLQMALESAATENGRKMLDLKVSLAVFQSGGCFTGCSLWSPSVRNLEVFGKMRSILEPFRQYAIKNLGQASMYWWYSPAHLEDAWERFQRAVAETWEIAGVNSKEILQKIRSIYEDKAPFRTASLQRWEQQRMVRQDKNRNRPWNLRVKNDTGRLERWERRQMAMQDKKKHRPWHLREKNPNARLEFWERQQMALEDQNKHRPKRLRVKQLQKSNSGSRLSRKLIVLRKLIARWGRMLTTEAKLLDKERQKLLRQRKKDKEERRRVEVLNQKRQREEERLRRERIRKRMRSDLTMDDIIGKKDAWNRVEWLMLFFSFVFLIVFFCICIVFRGGTHS